MTNYARHSAKPTPRRRIEVRSSDVAAAIAAGQAQRRKRNILAFAACFVVLATALALMLPAVATTQAALDGDQEALQAELALEAQEAEEQVEGEPAEAEAVADAEPEEDSAAADDDEQDADEQEAPAADDAPSSEDTPAADKPASEPADDGDAPGADADDPADPEPTDEDADANVNEDEDADEDTDSALVKNATLTYEDDAMKVVAKVQDKHGIPSDAQLVVTAITQDMEDYDAYMTALNRGYGDDTYNSDNSLLFDVSVVSNGTEYEPVDGKVDVSLRFKDNQLTDALGVDAQDESLVKVIHLPVKGSTAGRDVAEVGSESLDASQIKREPVEDASAEVGKSEQVEFSLDSLSVITVTSANTTVNFSGSLQGTNMKSIPHNLYAYLVGTNDAYGAKIEFVNGSATASVSNVPAGQYELYLVYPKVEDDTLQTGAWNRNNVLDSNKSVWTNADGAYIFGYSSKMPSDMTISSSNNTVSFVLEVGESHSTANVETIMDRALNYGIVADDIKYHVRAYTNFAAKHIDISNSNDSTIYSHRADGIDVVPNILADIDHNGQPMSTQDKPANYYVTDADKGKVSSSNTTDTIIRNKSEIEDRVEIMKSNALKQAAQLAAITPDLTLSAGIRAVDVSPYPANGTIVLDATAISGEQNGFTIYKRAGQTVVFNFNGQNVAPPQNTKIVIVDDNGNQMGNTYVAGDQMRNAPASDGDVWNKVIWNFPDAQSVTATNCIGGIFMVPNGSFNAANKGGGWIVARDKVTVTNEWYGFPGNDEPFKQKIIRKTFVGITEDEVDPDFAVKLWTHTNDSTVDTTNEHLISTLVMKPSTDDSLVKDPTGANDQTGYLNKGTDENGNFFVEWKTPSISVGNEHMVTEVNSKSTAGQVVKQVDFTGPFSTWSQADQKYVWVSRDTTFDSEEKFAGVFNVSSHDEDYRQYAYITNTYVDPTHFNLSVEKKVVDPGNVSDKSKQYTFNIDLGSVDQDSYAYELYNAAGVKTSDGTLSFTSQQVGGKTVYRAQVQLMAGQRIVVKQIAKGTTYNVTEESEAEVAYDVSYDANASGTLDSYKATTVTNTYEASYENIVITKTVKPASAASELGDAFAVNVVNVDDRTDSHVLKLADAIESNVAGGKKYTWTIQNVPVGARYRIAESGADISGYLRTSTISIAGGAAAEITANDILTVAEANASANRADLVNSYEAIPDTDKVNVKKVYQDANGNALSLEGNDFQFSAQPWDADAKQVVAGSTAQTVGNLANGLATFENLEFPTGTTYYLLKESIPQDKLEGVTYDESHYVAKVEAPEVQSGGGVDYENTSSNGVYLKLTFQAEAGWYRVLSQGASDAYNYRAEKTISSTGTVTLSFDPYNETKTYYIAKIAKDGNGNPYVEKVLYDVTVACSYPTGSGTLRLDSVDVAVHGSSGNAGSGSTASDEQSIKYYKLNDDGTLGDEIDGIPTFTNVYSAGQSVKIVKVGFDNTSATSAETPLPGATFHVFESDANWNKGKLVYNKVSDADGLVLLETCAPGNYLVEEVQAPDGYTGLTGTLRMTVGGEGVEVSSDTVGDYGTMYDLQEDADAGVWTLTVKNVAGMALPSTGGMGTLPFAVGGFILIVVAGFVLLRTRRFS